MQVSLLFYIVVFLFVMHRYILLYRVSWNIHNLSVFKVSHPWFKISYPKSDHKGTEYKCDMSYIMKQEIQN